MLSRILPIALILAVPALAACETGNPKAKMGPEWARYVGSTYRRSYGGTGHVTASARPSRSGPPRSGASSLTASADIPLERPVGRSARSGQSGPVAVAIPPRRSRRPARTVGDAVPTYRPAAVSSTARAFGPSATPPAPTPPAPVSGIRPVRGSRHLQGTVRSTSAATPARNWVSPAVSTPARTATAPAAPARSAVSTAVAGDDRTQRQFLRLKIHGLDASDTEAPFRVRKMLSGAPGVKEVVFSSKTGTAIVVIEPGTDPDDVRTALAAPYRASLLR